MIQLNVVGHLDQRAVLQVDLSLAGCGNLMMMHFDRQAGIDHGAHHLGTQILHGIVRRNREIATLPADFMAAARYARVPRRFLAVNRKACGMTILEIADLVEDEEFCLGPHVDGISQTGRFHVVDCFGRYRTRIAAVWLIGDGLKDIADHAERLVLQQRVNQRRRRIGTEHHVAGFDGLEATDRRTVKAHALIKDGIGIKLLDRHGEMVPLTEQIGKFDINHLDTVVSDGSHDILRCATT